MTMMSRKWVRVLVFIALVLPLARVAWKIRNMDPHHSIQDEFDLGALIRQSSGGMKRIPPESNYTDRAGVSDSFDTSAALKTNQTGRAKDASHVNKEPVNTRRSLPTINAEVAAAMWQEATNHTGLQLEEMRQLAAKPWLPNKENILKFRHQLHDFKSTIDNVVLTRNNTKVGQTLRYSLSRDSYINITEEVVEFLPKESPFSKLKPHRCAVMGGSGILLESGCGKDIDSADFIFRCNMPELRGFERDVGRKSNMTTINTMTIVAQRFHLLQSSSDSKKFSQALRSYHGYLWMPMFSLTSGYSFSLRVARFVRQSKDLPRLEMVIGNPDHFAAAQDFWTERLHGTRLSTGLYMVTLALSMCDETHLYGFWPFSRDLDLRPTSYHYYDSLQGPLRVHNFTDEFNALLKMHSDGILKLQMGRC